MSARRFPSPGTRPPFGPPSLVLLSAVLLAAVLLAAGCGEDPATVSAPAAPAAPRSAPVPAAPKPSGTPRPAADAPLPEGAERLVDLGERPNFRLLGTAPAVRPEDRFVAAAPIYDDAGRMRVESLPDRPAPAGERVPLPAGFTPVPGTGYTAGLPDRVTCEADGAEMALVPGGVYELRDSAGKPLPVFLDPYYIDRTEVTADRYRRFLSEAERAGDEPQDPGLPGDEPVRGVLWRDALLYARWAGKALPTEAEWAAAARGPRGYRFVWGEEDRALWGRPRAFGQIDPVASFRTDRSPLGVYDLAGNVGEWTGERYAPEPLDKERPDAGGVYRNPTGDHRGGTDWIVRGRGPGWDNARRENVPGTTRADNLGFRCVMRPSDPSAPEGKPGRGERTERTRTPGGQTGF